MFIEPVFGKQFFGREEVLAVLHKRVSALKGGYRQNLALAGPMLAGKSSVLRHFLSHIDDPDLIPIYIEMGDEDFSTFCKRFMASLLHRYLISEGIEPKSGLDALKEQCAVRLPDTLLCIDGACKDISKRRENAAYQKLLGLTSVFKTETGKSCVVILDEFQNLSQFSLKKPFQVFGKFIMVQKNTMYIVSSSQKSLLREILAKKLSLLFGNFEVLEINGFDNQTSRSFIADRVKGMDRSNEAQDYIIQLSEGSPFYLETLATVFESHKHSEPADTDAKECLLSTMAELLYDSNGVLNQYFSNNINFFLEKRSRRKFIPILMSLSRGNKTIKAIMKDLNTGDRSIGKKLRNLQDMDLVHNSGSFYRISDKLFEYWLRYVHSLKTHSMIDDMDIKYLEFKRAIADDYDSFREFNSKDVKTVIMDLLRSFSGDKVRVNLNDRMLPRFEKVSSRKISERVDQLNALVGCKKWIFRLAQGDIANEQDINDLCSLRQKKDGPRIIRRIFLPLKGIDQNAYLLAKEKNVWIWDIRQINRLLRIYGRFEIVL